MNVREEICYIVGAGDFGDESLRPEKGDLVIAADGGLNHLLKRGILPDLAVGDFDSLGYVPELEQVVTLKPEKDDTDMNHALEIAWEKGYRRYCLYGGTGGRISHTIANIQMLDEIACRGGQAAMVGIGTRYYVIRNRTMNFPREEKGYLSVFCLGDRASGVTLKGFRYEMEDGELTKEFPLGVSNEFIGVEGTVRVERGSLLLITETI